MKFYGNIGFGVPQETEPGIWVNTVVERTYYGDVLKNTRKNENGEHLNDNIQVSNQLSILADDYLNENFSAILYVEWMGARWKVPSVDVQRPRLILQIGGVYNGLPPTENGDDGSGDESGSSESSGDSPWDW